MSKSLTLPAGAMNPAQRLAPARSATRWIDRLAAWADRQPAHHRLGCWTAPGLEVRSPRATPR